MNRIIVNVLCEGATEYNKVKSGIMVAGEVGIEKQKEQCPHFKEWISRLEALGEVDDQENCTKIEVITK